MIIATNFLAMILINLFILLLEKGVYPYEYMDNCKKFSEI